MVPWEPSGIHWQDLLQSQCTWSRIAALPLAHHVTLDKPLPLPWAEFLALLGSLTALERSVSNMLHVLFAGTES